MNHLFSLNDGFAVPDGTMLHDIFGPKVLGALGLPINEHGSLALGESLTARSPKFMSTQL